MGHDLFFAQSNVGRYSLIHELIDALDSESVEDGLSVLRVVADVTVEEIVRGLQVGLHLRTVQVVKLLI